jgi:hypothetical protein
MSNQQGRRRRWFIGCHLWHLQPCAGFAAGNISEEHHFGLGGLRAGLGFNFGTRAQDGMRT